MFGDKRKYYFDTVKNTKAVIYLYFIV